MYKSCFAKQAYVKSIFDNCSTKEERYEKIIELGKKLPALPDPLKTPHSLVKGCQSMTYLYATLENGTVHFQASSDALISAGLAMILLMVYNDESPEVILKCPPTFLEDLGISASLTPSRANGLYSMHLRMQQEALKLLSKI